MQVDTAVHGLFDALAACLFGGIVDMDLDEIVCAGAGGLEEVIRADERCPLVVSQREVTPEDHAVRPVSFVP